MHILNPQKLSINLIYPANIIFKLLKAIYFRKYLLILKNDLFFFFYFKSVSCDMSYGKKRSLPSRSN